MRAVIRPVAYLVLLAAAAVIPSVAQAGEYALDRAHAQAEFTVTHLVLSKVHGTIPLVSGELDVGPNNLPQNATATFDASALTTQDDRRDAELRKNYLEVDKYPTLTFVERKVEGTPQAFTMTGDLTLHGVTKPVVLKGQIVGSMDVQGKKHVAYTAQTTIDRRDFGIVFSPVLNGQMFVANEVDIEIEADAGHK